LKDLITRYCFRGYNTIRSREPIEKIDEEAYLEYNHGPRDDKEDI
jgi:hypothetical protein